MTALNILAGLEKFIEEFFKTYRSKKNIPVERRTKYDKNGKKREETVIYKIKGKLK